MFLVSSCFHSTSQFALDWSTFRCWVIVATSFLVHFFEVPLNDWHCSDLQAACEPLLFSGIHKRNFSPRSQMISVSKLSSLQLWKLTHEQTGFPSLTLVQLVLFWNMGLLLGGTDGYIGAECSQSRWLCRGCFSSENLALVSVGAEMGWALISCIIPT